MVAAPRCALVTGAASGIGRATVELLLQRGHRVVAVDRRPEAFDWLPDDGTVVAVGGDITTEEANATAVATAVEHFGSLDIAVLNAGMPASGPLDTLDMALFDAAYNVNVRAVALGIRAAMAPMRAGGGGSIVITASTAGLGGEQRRWPYATAKAAVLNLMRSAAIELALDGIRVNAVCPGPVHTGMTARLASLPDYDQLRSMIPLQRWGEPDEVARVICFLASPEASFVTGTTVPVDGGLSSTNHQSLPPAGQGVRRDR